MDRSQDRLYATTQAPVEPLSSCYPVVKRLMGGRPVAATMIFGMRWWRLGRRVLGQRRNIIENVVGGRRGWQWSTDGVQ